MITSWSGGDLMDRQCHAKSKQSGERCKRAASIGHTVCVIHGGKSPKGPASTTFTHGKYSKHVPSRLAANYEFNREQETKLHMGDEIALLDARISDLLDNTDHGESGELWKATQAAALAVHKTQGGGVKGADGEITHSEAIENLILIVANGMEDWRTWNEIRDTLESKRKLADTEIKRVATAHKILTQEQGLTMIGRIQSIVLQYVTSEHDRRELSRALAAITD